MPNVGLVLSGGFAKGAYQIGVLKAMRECFGDTPVRYISASSVGSLNAYAFARDRLDAAEDMWRNLEYQNFRSFVKNYIRGPYIAGAIREMTGQPGGPPLPCLYTACFNVTRLKLHYINLKNVPPRRVKDFLQASVMLPVFSRAVEIGGKKYIDGAIIDNIPVRPLMRHPLDYAVVVHFDSDNYLFENDYFDSKLIKINFLDDKIIKNSLAFDRDSVSYMIGAGYEQAMTLFGMIFKNGADDLEYIYRQIRFLNGLRGKQKFRLTGDIVVGNINKVLKKIVASKI
ncbi:MAG: patatin-like phospholipase family protein [Oscillospiraceae bacterium]|nr:patatin-like phospholipase family protein [Oscillospiraceae bacterium]